MSARVEPGDRQGCPVFAARINRGICLCHKETVEDDSANFAAFSRKNQSTFAKCAFTARPDVNAVNTATRNTTPKTPK